jgi:hypothetical protein
LYPAALGAVAIWPNIGVAWNTEDTKATKVTNLTKPKNLGVLSVLCVDSTLLTWPLVALGARVEA